MESTDKPTKKVNPLEAGVSYAEFVKALGTKSVSEYCKGMLTAYEIEWIKTEIENYKHNQKNK